MHFAPPLDGLITLQVVTFRNRHCEAPQRNRHQLPACSSQHVHIMALHQHALQGFCSTSRGRVRAAAAAGQQQPTLHQPQHCRFASLHQTVHHGWGCAPAQSQHASPGARLASVCCRVLSPEQPVAAAPAEPAATLSPVASLSSLEEGSQATCVPEEFELAPGVLSTVDRTSPPAPEDAYMCPGCTKAECQVGVLDV